MAQWYLRESARILSLFLSLSFIRGGFMSCVATFVSCVVSPSTNLRPKRPGVPYFMATMFLQLYRG